MRLSPDGTTGALATIARHAVAVCGPATVEPLDVGVSRVGGAGSSTGAGEVGGPGSGLSASANY